MVGEHTHPNLCPPGQTLVYSSWCRQCILQAWSQGFGIGTCPPPEPRLKGPGDRQWRWMASLQKMSEIEKSCCSRGTRNQPGPVENRNGDGASCPTLLLAYQGNNSAAQTVLGVHQLHDGMPRLSETVGPVVRRVHHYWRTPPQSERCSKAWCCKSTLYNDPGAMLP